MTTIKTLALSGLILSLSATGFAYAQSTSPASPSVATPGTEPPAAPPSPSGAAPSVGDDDMSLPGDDLDDEAADDAGSDPAADADPMARPDRPEPGAGRGIDKADFQGRRAERLKAADTNGDGILSTDELEAMVLKQMAERRAAKLERRFDVDGDGRVTLAEIESQRAKRFALYDLNDDGRIDGRELAILHRDARLGDMRRGGGDDRRGGPSSRGRHGERHGRHGGEGWRERHHGGDRMPRGERGYE